MNPHAMEQAIEAESVPFPMIRGLLQHRRAVVDGTALAVAVLGIWLAARTGWVELYPLALLAAFAARAVLRVAVEVVDLVAETLMPR